MEFATTTSTTTASPIIYPQLSNYRSPNGPKNIQDIIGYIAPNPLALQGQFIGRDGFGRYRPSQLHPYFVQTQNNIRKNGSKRLTNENIDDPFFYYKPRDPSDINLLATASFRFAPPIWNNFRNTLARPLPAASEAYFKPTVNKEKEKKPLLLTLNVYPMENEFSETDVRNTVPKYNFTSSYIKPQDIESDPVGKIKKIKPSKMVIHLNLFSEPLESFEPRRKKIILQND